MFQFPDDDDPDVEGLLDLPLDELDKLAGKCELNSPKCPETNNLKDMLDDCDDNELILSMVDNVDCPANDQSSTKKSSNNFGFKILDSITTACGFPLENKNSQSSPEQYITTNNVKHKLPSAEPCTSKAPRVEYERKFPGPAGLIPKQVPGPDGVIPKKRTFTTPVKYQVLPDRSPKQADVPPEKKDSVFENGCWHQLIKDCETISPRLSAIIEENSVASVRRMSIGRSQSRKLPLFAAVITDISYSDSNDPCVILRDSTGEISGALHAELWEKYGHLITIGTALLLKQVGVSNMTKSRKLYVNVTSYNIVKFYTPRSGAPILVTEVANLSPQDFNSQIKKNERTVFEETHPNIPIPVKEVPTRKASIPPSVSKTDNIKPIRDENEPKKVEIKAHNIKPIRNENEPKKVESNAQTDTPVHSVVKPNKIQTQNEVFFDDLQGIDVDSFFGEF